jgi:hypothetical protein
VLNLPARVTLAGPGEGEKYLSVFFCFPRKCLTSRFRMSPEMITKLIQILGFFGGSIHLRKQTPRHFGSQMEFHF